MTPRLHASPMDLLAQGIPLSLLIDLAWGPDPVELLLDDPADD